MGKRISVWAAVSGGLVGAMVEWAACGPPPVPPAPDEPAVLADYVAITEQVAAVVEAHPKDRAAVGEALAAQYAQHKDAWTQTVTRMRALYAADIERGLGDRMPNRHPELLERLELASKRLAPHVSGEPWVLHDEHARDVLAAIAINDDYAKLIQDKWQETGPKDPAP